MSKSYDVVIIGAGSVGVPAAMAMAAQKIKVLVIDSMPSPGQKNNKKAIGGIRATHSDFGKIKVCQRSIEIFSSWEETHGDDIGWLQNGYSYPAYNDSDELKLKDLMKIQHAFGLNIKWISADEYSGLVPGISTNGLRGSTYSPQDGSASPLLAMSAFYFESCKLGAEYRFDEQVKSITVTNGNVTKVNTDRDSYSCGQVINAAGNYARNIGEMVGENTPVTPDNHEGAITEPVKRFFGPMVVDMRPSQDSANYYFYQNKEGQVVFCITPSPPLLGIDDDSTSWFFPQVAQRMVTLYPRLAILKVRRSWRGQYPNTPDGFPIVGRSRHISNFIQCAGMCGQGFMLGPGLGELMTRIVSATLTPDDHRILESFDPYREFGRSEVFK